MMRRVVILALTFWWMTGSITAQGQETSQAISDGGHGAAGQTIAIAAPTGWPPFSDPGLPGGGLLPAIVTKALEAAGYAPRIVHLPLAGARNAALDGTFAGWIGAGPGAADHFDLSAPLTVIEPVLVTHADLALDWTGVGRLRGMTLCSPMGQALPAEVLLATVSGGLPRETPASLDRCAAMMVNDPAVFAIADPQMMAQAMHDAGLDLHSLHYSILPIGSLPISLAVSESRPDAARLLGDLERGMAIIRASGELAHIVQEAWAAPPLDPAAPRLLLWGQTEAGFPPYTLYLGANWGGFIPTVLEELGHRTGHRFHPQYLPASRIWRLFRQGVLDLAVPMDPAWFGEDMPPGVLSLPLAETRDRLIIAPRRAALLGEIDRSQLGAILSDGPVAVVRGYAFAFDGQFDRLDRPDEASVVEVVLRDRVPFGIVEERVMSWLMNHGMVDVLSDSLPPFGPPVSNGSIHLLLHPHNADLLPEIDAALTAMVADGTLDRLRETWLDPL